MSLLNDKKNLFIIIGIILFISVNLIIMIILNVDNLRIIISTSIGIITGGLFGHFLISYFNGNREKCKIIGIQEYDMNMNYINLFNFYKKRYKYEIIINNEKKWTDSDYLKKYNIGDNLIVYNNSQDNKYTDSVLAPLIGSGLLFITFTILPLLNNH
jgi:hypothetical protein